MNNFIEMKEEELSEINGGDTPPWWYFLGPPVSTGYDAYKGLEYFYNRGYRNGLNGA